MNTMIRNSSACLMMLLLVPPAIASESVSDPESGEEENDAESVELSEPPLDQVTYPDDRPEWVNEADNGKPYTVIDGNKIVVVSPLCDTSKQCEELLMISTRVAADQYVIDLVDFVADGTFYEFSDEEIIDLITRQYDGTAKQGDMDMYERALELTFTPEKQREIRAASKNIEVDRRLHRMGGFFLGGLVMLFGGSAAIGAIGRLRGQKTT